MILMKIFSYNPTTDYTLYKSIIVNLFLKVVDGWRTSKPKQSGLDKQAQYYYLTLSIGINVVIIGRYCLLGPSIHRRARMAHECTSFSRFHCLHYSPSLHCYIAAAAVHVHAIRFMCEYPSHIIPKTLKIPFSSIIL